jgi:chromosome segregation ATPase
MDSSHSDERNVAIAEMVAFLPVVVRPAAEVLPELATGEEFRAHTRRSILHPRYNDLKKMERLLDEYKLSGNEYRELYAAHDHGCTALRELYKAYFEQLNLADLQRAEMQADLAHTERRIRQLDDHLEKRRHDLMLHSDHVEGLFSITTTKLSEVCKWFRKLRDEHFEDLVRRNNDGFLSRLQAAIKNAEHLIARIESRRQSDVLTGIDAADAGR